MKPTVFYPNIPFLLVTPRAGMWIETTAWTSDLQGLVVTPRAGMWIETEDAQKVVAG